LHPSSFPAFIKEFELLDIDGNGDLDEDELAKLLTEKPHIKFAIDFSHGDSPEKNETTLSIVEHIPSIEIIAQPAGDRVALMLGATRLDVSAHDLMPAQDTEQTAAGSQMRLMVHDQIDPLCEVLDANADGRLGEHEVASSAERLLKFDANKNGQLDTSELPYTMIVAFLRGERPGEQSFYRPQSSRVAPASDAPSWFIHSDFNGDGDVSSHEFVGSAEKFKRLDADGDGFISSAEAKALTSAE
jgi:Ca2+-binding EF-hand superfamily protein